MGETPLVPARMVNEFVYCPRLAYLMWTQAEWSESADTVDGRRVHARADRPGPPLPSPETIAAGEPAVTTRSITLSSATLGVIAKIDIAEAEDGAVTPVDYKRGKRPHMALGRLRARTHSGLPSGPSSRRARLPRRPRAPSGTRRAASVCASSSTTRSGLPPTTPCTIFASSSRRAASRRRSRTARNARAAPWSRSACPMR